MSSVVQILFQLGQRFPFGEVYEALKVMSVGRQLLDAYDGELACLSGYEVFDGLSFFFAGSLVLNTSVSLSDLLCVRAWLWLWW